jgi:uncharacterized membrane protein YecN with MAPEG domain
VDGAHHHHQVVRDHQNVQEVIVHHNFQDYVKIGVIVVCLMEAPDQINVKQDQNVHEVGVVENVMNVGYHQHHQDHHVLEDGVL